jgi:hypothetical protein
MIFFIAYNRYNVTSTGHIPYRTFEHVSFCNMPDLCLLPHAHFVLGSSAFIGCFRFYLDKDQHFPVARYNIDLPFAVAIILLQDFIALRA